MKKRIIAAVLGVMLFLSACSDPTEFSDSEKLSSSYERSSDTSVTFNYSDGAQEAPSSYNNYANYITGFELKLFRNACNTDTESFAFVPINSVMQLSLLANGANKDTKQEITLALGGELDIDAINECSSYFKSRMESVSKLGDRQTDELTGKKPETNEFISLNNALFINNQTDVRSGFMQKNADFFGSDIFRFSFEDEHSAAKIKNAGYLLETDKNESMIAASRLELSDAWLQAYDVESIVSKPFNGGKNINFMSSQECFMQSDSAKGIIKYTAKNPLKILIIMPNEDKNIRDYLKTFDSVEYNNLIDSIDYTKRETVEIPQFEISAQSHEMSGILQKSGLYTLFSDETDFSGIAHTEGLVLNQYYDFTPSIQFSAGGLSASSASASTADNALPQYKIGDESSENPDLTFDRPFIFIIADNETNIPIYIGTYGANAK